MCVSGVLRVFQLCIVFILEFYCRWDVSVEVTREYGRFFILEDTK